MGEYKNKNFNQIVQTLKNFELFSNIEEDILKKIVNECEYIEWKKAQDLPYDISSKYTYIILEGRLKVTQIDPNSGRSLALFLLSEGDIFDIFPLLDGKEHIVFPIPMDNMKLLRIKLKKAREWIIKYPKFNETLLPYLGRILRDMESFSESLVFGDTTTRLANLILKHTNRCKDESNYYPVKLINNLSHESLAELIGSVRSVVTQQLNKLKQEEIIIASRGKMKIKNLEKLNKKCDIFHH